MDRSDAGFAGSVVGAVMVSAGAAGYTPGWLFPAAGALLALGGSVTLGLRGSLLLLACGVWVAVSAALGWAAAAWNLMAAGLLAVACGFTAGVAGLRAVRRAGS